MTFEKIITKELLDLCNCKLMTDNSQKKKIYFIKENINNITYLSNK